MRSCRSVRCLGKEGDERRAGWRGRHEGQNALGWRGTGGLWQDTGCWGGRGAQAEQTPPPRTASLQAAAIGLGIR